MSHTCGTEEYRLCHDFPEAYQIGWSNSGTGESENPYDKGSDEWAAYELGWKDRIDDDLMPQMD